MSRRSELRATVWEISGGQCEHPIFKVYRTIRCQQPAAEMAHIVPRGMGHKGDRDVLSNVMAACPTHARSTDDLSSKEWQHVPGDFRYKRKNLTRWVAELRSAQGWEPT